ncbi:hypothetical protein M409DRAFT_16159 [Zasmidium cellare ATCC 36951]|uniref:ABC transporter domain-containing protein n=1 Tax=Zasmidium cellare ATCC 36951 TaxID=1080233 RepID=A0A6A6D6D3_ZASCE|nr:uncharacterized protein M409DRAFT_16159 [Zasmidium cellare ATCC 36951]KAF2173890.1 hypothetical protein M409DRAFT_16159 [Zasmidium cellare ATCC 36951]
MSGRGRGGGRGAYYKEKYGGGRGRGRGVSSSHEFNDSSPQSQQQRPGPPKDWQQLEYHLQGIDGQQYGAYKRLLGKYEHAGPRFTLSVDHVQGDAYAAPSKVRSIVPWSETGFPKEYLDSDVRRIALCDFVSRIAGSIIQAKHLDRNVGNSNGGWSGPKGGAFSICMPGTEILPRTSAVIAGGDSIELRFTVSLPAAGRTILGQQAYQILAVNLVEIVRKALLHANLDQQSLGRHIESAERQESLRSQLSKKGLIAFISNGAVLPRASGASQAPLSGASVVGFRAPAEMEVTLTSSDGQSFTGMGIPKGVTLLTGGGFHGKSTLLEALELGVYNHIPGDGREAVVTDPTAFKIRAEDGRGIASTDISPFIRNLPGGKSTTAFSTEDASGSTSMSANIQEALEAGCKTLLIDEDSSATNLLVRDQRMQTLIRNEPITPLISKVSALYNQHGVSTVIVIGGLGDWLAVANRIIAMDSYVPHDITEKAQGVVRQFPGTIMQDAAYGSLPKRSFRVDLQGLKSPFASRKRFIALRSQIKDAVDDPSQAESGVDLEGLDQIVEIGQSRTIAVLLQRIAGQTGARGLSLGELLKRLEMLIGVDKCSLASLEGGDLVAVRPLELAAALSRLRGAALQVDATS